MPYPYGGLRIRPVISLGKVRSTVTIPTFDVLTNEPVGNCVKVEDAEALFSYLSAGYELFVTPAVSGGIYFDLWFKPISMIPPQDNMCLFKRICGGTFQYITFGLFVDFNFKLQLRIGKSTVLFTDFITTDRVLVGEWNHVGVVWDGSASLATEGYIWLNGVKSTFTIGADQRAPLVDDPSFLYVIGKYPASAQVGGKFYIDELRLWDTPPDDAYFKHYAMAPRAVPPSDGDSTLISYFRFNETLAGLIDSKLTGDILTISATAPAMITTEEYPSSLGDSYPKVHIPLDEIGQDFTFKLRPERPSSADFGLAIYYLDEDGNDRRYFLWRSDGLRGVDHIPDYSGEKVTYTNARLEVWYNYLDRRVSLAAPITITLGQLLERTSYASQGNTNLISPAADTTISAPFPLTFPITFNS